MKSMNKTLIERKVTCDGCGARMLGASKVIGFACVFQDEHFRPIPGEVYKGRIVSPSATSNQAEFEALRLALQKIVAKDTPDSAWVIYTDSKYTQACFYNSEMAKKPWLVPIVKDWYNLAAKIGWRVDVRWLESELNDDADNASREAILDTNL